MLTIADFQRALDQAPELEYVNTPWTKRYSYLIVESERGAYVCAPSFLVSQRPGTTETTYMANPSYGGRLEEEILENMREYFLRRSYCRSFNGTAEEEQKTFIKEFLRKSYEATDESGEGRLYRWLREEHGELDEETTEFLQDLLAETFNEIDEITKDWLCRLRNEAIEDFRVGKQEQMINGLRSRLYPGVEARDLERLLKTMREDLDAGISLAETLDKIAPIDEHGSTTYSAFIEKVLFNMMQDIFRQLEGKLNELVEEQKEVPRPFYPLSSAGLFLDFAKLGNQEDITQDEVLAWVSRYGILGLGLEEYVGDVKPSLFLGGPQESVLAFTQEAREVNLTKRTYEAALRLDSSEKSVVAKAVQELQDIFEWPEHCIPSLPECSERAWNAVITQVQSCLDKHCVVRWRRAGSGLVEFLEFKTLVGAMYMQFAWVLRERANVRRCKRCGRPVKGYRNKRFCSRDCKTIFINRLNRERRNEKRLSFSMPSATKEEVESLAATRGMSIETFFREMLRIYKDSERSR